MNLHFSVQVAKRSSLNIEEESQEKDNRDSNFMFQNFTEENLCMKLNTFYLLFISMINNRLQILFPIIKFIQLKVP